MSEHTLLAVAIGPVQTFIASARRCQDLWYGSWLLSHLAKRAALAMEEHDAATLVFPGAVLKAMDPKVSVANKILARVEGDVEKACEVAEAGREALVAELRRIREATFTKLGAGERGDSKRGQNFLEDRANAQVDELVEYVWAAVPEDGDYAAARRRADRLLNARKNTRVWTQPSWATAGVPKSSLDGERESVLHESLFDATRRGDLKAEQLRRWYGVHPAERLCGVGLLKRHGIRPDGWEEPEVFYSTSHLAARPVMLRYQGEADAISAYRDSLWDALGHHGFIEHDSVKAETPGWGRLDGAMLFESRIREAAKENDREPRPALAALRTLQSSLEDFPAEVVPYYALLLADGDRMGDAIRRQDQFDAHRALSQRLVEFAQSAREAVKEHRGSPIYAGGDDVLAYVPLHRILACADELRRRFEKILDDFRDEQGPTLSVGVAIVHHLEPMDRALGLARRAEKLAKQKRNSLAVILDKRGGSPIEVTGAWDEAPVPLHARLRHMIRLHRLESISDRAGFELLELAAVASGVRSRGTVGRTLGQTEDFGVPPAMVAADVERILQRKQPRGETDRKIAQADLTQLRRWLGLAAEGGAPADPIPRDWTPAWRERLDPGRIGAELTVARLFAKVEDQAGNAKPTEAS